LTSYLLNRSKTIYLKANLTAQHLCVDSLLMTETPTAGAAHPSVANQNTESTALLLPENIQFDTNVEAAKFRYRKFEAEQMKAYIVYQPRALDIRSIAFSTMSGKLTGNGGIANDKGNNIRVVGETTLDKVDVQQLFRTFDNFGQDVLRDEHVKGKLSGDLVFAVGWDSRMQLRQNELAVEGRMNLDGGELVNFEPLNSLSRFVALEELQNIRFSRLSTQISVRNKKLVLPQTDVRTSSFDISLSGEHHFDNSYAYRVKILLSELLAAKARKAKRENRENEYVEDGGKRAALYMRIAGQGSDVKINYDKQSAKASVAADIRNEKQTLKSILKEELGLFRKDTTLLKPEKPDNSSKLRFTFDED
jgi:hypothetical protein